MLDRVCLLRMPCNDYDLDFDKTVADQEGFLDLEMFEVYKGVTKKWCQQPSRPQWPV